MKDSIVNFIFEQFIPSLLLDQAQDYNMLLQPSVEMPLVLEFMAGCFMNVLFLHILHIHLFICCVTCRCLYLLA